MTAKQVLIGTAAIFCVLLITESANAQLFRKFASSRQATRPTVWTQPRSVSPSVTPRPVTGYGSNLHRNFVIRQEQQKTARTGIPPRQRVNNILWTW